ncbi:MAG: hypothetical protein WDN25_24920 [Acetobacteraceae bacterium]
MPKTRQTAGKPATQKAGKPFTASKDRAARKAKPATVSLDQAEHDAARDAPPHRTLTTVGRKGRQAKPAAPASTPETAYAEAEAIARETGTPIAATLAAAAPTPALPETHAGAPQALVIDVGSAECTTLANRIAALLGREVRIMDMLTGRLLDTVAAPERKAHTGGGKARSVIVEACSRPGGATAAELFTATGWKFASWSHQLKIAAAATGLANAIRKVDGTTRYFLTQPATAPAADAPAPEARAPEAPADETAMTDATGEAEPEQEAA